MNATVYPYGDKIFKEAISKLKSQHEPGVCAQQLYEFLKVLVELKLLNLTFNLS